MAIFEGYERRIDKINAELAKYGIKGIDEAKAICDTCPAKDACLTDALATQREHDWGIRGGTTDTERRKMRQEGAA